ncbi:hypothetical protein OJHNALOF_01220 [Oceanimonas sp. MB9]|nr:hypothetical protein [Oceanimonas sp. MB9]
MFCCLAELLNFISFMLIGVSSFNYGVIIIVF